MHPYRTRQAKIFCLHSFNQPNDGANDEIAEKKSYCSRQEANLKKVFEFRFHNLATVSVTKRSPQPLARSSHANLQEETNFLSPSISIEYHAQDTFPQITSRVQTSGGSECYIDGSVPLRCTSWHCIGRNSVKSKRQSIAPFYTKITKHVTMSAVM